MSYNGSTYQQQLMSQLFFVNKQAFCLIMLQNKRYQLGSAISAYMLDTVL